MNKKIKKSELRKTIGLRLREIRKILSFTQEIMAEHLGTGRPNYSRSEIGDTFPNHVSMNKLGTEFDISLDWLICGKGPMFFKEKQIGDNHFQDQALLEKSTNPEAEELLKHMRQIPLLYHEIMELFYRFKIENKELLEAETR